MPGNLLTADTNFPDLEKKGSTEEKLKAVSGYLYMLLEQLRYTLANLGQDNFNDTELNNIGRLITGPLTVRVEETEKGMAQISITVDGITSRVESVENGAKEFSEVSQTVKGLNIRTVGGQSSLSGVALYFYDGAGNIIGRVNMDDTGGTYAGESVHRMFVGTKSAGGIRYSLKLESAGNSSYSSDGNIYIRAGTDDTAAGGMAQITGGGGTLCTNDSAYGVNGVYHDLILIPPAGRHTAVRDGHTGGWFEFRAEGIYHNGVRCSMSDTAAGKLIDDKLKAFAAKNGLTV